MDLIDRQAAIDVLYKMLHDCFWADDEELDAVITTLNDLPSVQPVAKDTNVPSTELIRRQAAIDRINKQREHLQPDIYPQDKIGDAAYRICAEFIERLPPVQPEQDREFLKLTVRNSNGRPYYSIIYLEVDDNGVGHDFEGYSSYSLDVISDYLKKYFMPPVQPETCDTCKHGYFGDERCNDCRVRFTSHYERRTDERTD